MQPARIHRGPLDRTTPNDRSLDRTIFEDPTGPAHPNKFAVGHRAHTHARHRSGPTNLVTRAHRRVIPRPRNVSNRSFPAQRAVPDETEADAPGQATDVGVRNGRMLSSLFTVRGHRPG